MWILIFQFFYVGVQGPLGTPSFAWLFSCPFKFENLLNAPVGIFKQEISVSSLDNKNIHNLERDFKVDNITCQALFEIEIRN